MLTTMMPEVDPVGGDPGSRHGGIDRQAGFSHEGDHHAVVRGISLDIDHARARSLDRIRDLGDDLQPAPL
jgi:hypothetical protein